MVALETCMDIAKYAKIPLFLNLQGVSQTFPSFTLRKYVQQQKLSLNMPVRPQLSMFLLGELSQISKKNCNFHRQPW